MTQTYLERLGARSRATGTVLCLGLDPDPEALPPGFTQDLVGLERFAALVLEAAAPHAAAVKPNLAFFDCAGVRLMLSTPEPGFDHPGSVLYFAVDDIQRTHDALRDLRDML